MAPGRFQLSMRHDLTGQQQMAAGCAMPPSSLSPLSSPLPSLSISPPAPNPVLSAWVFHALAGFCPQEGGCPVCEHHKASPGLEEEEPSAAFLEEEEHYSVPGRRGALCSILGSDNLHQSLKPTTLHTGSHGHLCASPRLLPPRRKNEHVAERTSPHTDRETHGEESNFGSEWGRCYGSVPQFLHVLYRGWGDPASPRPFRDNDIPSKGQDVSQGASVLRENDDDDGNNNTNNTNNNTKNKEKDLRPFPPCQQRNNFCF